MAYQTFQQEYMQIPVVTRVYATACVLTTAAVVSLNFIPYFFCISFGWGYIYLSVHLHLISKDCNSILTLNSNAINTSYYRHYCI